MHTTPVLKVGRTLRSGLKAFEEDRLHWLDEAAALGPVTGLQLGPVKCFVVSDGAIARQMLVTDGALWTRPPAVLAPIRIGGGENLFTQPDKAWAMLQPSVSPAFRRKALEQRLVDMDEIVAEEVGAIPMDATVDLELAMGRIALRVAAWVLLGERLEREAAEEIAQHQREIVHWVGTQLGKASGALPFAVGGRAREMRVHREVLNRYADQIIRQAQQATRQVDDVLGALLNARRAGKPLSHRQRRSHVLGLFLAGNETTTAALCWALAHAASAPVEWARVREDLNRVPFYVDETLRLTPAVWGLPRTPTKPGVVLNDGANQVRVRRGQPVTVYLRAINRESSIWSEPLRFDPSRHEHSDRNQQRSLIPFGLGPRGCIGQHLALAEMHSVVAALAQKGDVRIEGAIVEDPSFALRVKGGLRGRFTDREG